MKKTWITATLAGVLALAGSGAAFAEDKDKTKIKIDGTDPVTGERVKGKIKTKADDDGDYKERSDIRVGKTHQKSKIRSENDGDYKEKTTVHGPDGKYKSKTKIDK